jgi:hypothetical protein
MALRFEYFSDAAIALAQEVSNHPELMKRLANHPAAEFEVKLAEIAAYCDVVLDGLYTQEDLSKLCDILWRKLKAKSSPIILPN